MSKKSYIYLDTECLVVKMKKNIKKIHRMKELGMISFILSLINFSFILFMILFNIHFQTIHVHLIILGLAIFSVGLGLISYHNEKKISFGFYGIVLGSIVLIIIGLFFLIGIAWFMFHDIRSAYFVLLIIFVVSQIFLLWCYKEWKKYKNN
jgi:hypothetical protein